MIVLVIWLLSGMVSVSPVFKREFSLADPEINHQYRENQYVDSVNSESMIIFRIFVWVEWDQS